MKSEFCYSIEKHPRYTVYRLWELNPNYPTIIDCGGEYTLEALYRLEPRLLETPEADRCIEGY